MDTSSPREWTPQEDALLASAVSRYGARKWKAVAEEVTTRNSTQCQQRWTKALRPGLYKGHWSPQEDLLLLRLVGEFGTDWPSVAKNWAKALEPAGLCRTIKQIRERWTNKLDPSISRAAWSVQEDNQILALHKEIGNCWSNIATHLPGRVAEGVKTRFKTLLRRKRRALVNGEEEASTKKQKIQPKCACSLLSTQPECTCSANISSTSSISSVGSVGSVGSISSVVGIGSSSSGGSENETIGNGAASLLLFLGMNAGQAVPRPPCAHVR
jgi:hypothetical protein